MVKRQAPVKKNETLTLSIEDLTAEGSGVGKVDGYPIFIPYALPGEKVDIKVLKVNRNFSYGKLLAIHKPSTHRTDAPCPVFLRCGGCQLQHMSYDLQLEMKQNQVRNVMKKIAHLPDVPVHLTKGMADPWRYRNKVQVPVGEQDGQLITGFYQSRSHHIIDYKDNCLITEKDNDALVAKVREIANQFELTAYDEAEHRGILRHIMVRRAKVTKEAMIVLITRSKKLPQKDKLIEALVTALPNVKSIVQNINPKRTNVIFGDETNVLWGSEYIFDEINGLKFGISARSFYQVNPLQTEVLYEQALAYADIQEDDVVIDAYCGIGTISLFLAQKAKKVYGVEIVPEAIADAKKNAELNGMDNVEFVVGSAEKVMPQWTKEGLKPSVIVVDPPRKGCDEALLQAMLSMEPKRIVYVSCNPATLARDLRILEDGGYKTKEVQPVDMFPQTTHVECVAWMSRECR